MGTGNPEMDHFIGRTVRDVFADKLDRPFI
jgi:hypothetical protein